jgi:hypothetical protein
MVVSFLLPVQFDTDLNEGATLSSGTLCHSPPSLFSLIKRSQHFLTIHTSEPYLKRYFCKQSTYLAHMRTYVGQICLLKGELGRKNENISS